MERLNREKVLKNRMLAKMKLQSFPSNKVVTLKYVFSDLLGKQKTEKLVFENIIVSGVQNNNLLSSRFLKKAKFTSSDSGSSVISFNIKLYTEKDLENEKFDRNNDSAYLFYKNFLFPKLWKVTRFPARNNDSLIMVRITWSWLSFFAYFSASSRYEFNNDS